MGWSLTDKDGQQKVAATYPFNITTGAWSAGPPSNPNDGDIWIATGVDGNGTRWQFQYNAGSSSTYKWEFIGGPSMTRNYSGSGTSWNNAGFTQVGTTGLYTYTNVTSWAAGRAGDYTVRAHQEFIVGTTSAGTETLIPFWSASILGAGESSCDGSTGQNRTLFFNDFLIAGVASGDNIGAAWRHSTGSTVYATAVAFTPRRIA